MRYLILACLFLFSHQGMAISREDARSSYEAKINSLISEFMRKLTSEQNYNAVINVDVADETREVKQEINELEKTKNSNSTKKDHLPGFEPHSKVHDSELEVTTSKLIETNFKINSVYVLMILEKSLPGPVKDIVSYALKRKIKSLYGKTSEVEIKELELKPVALQESLYDLIKHGVRKNMFYFLVIAVILTLLALLVLFMFLWNLLAKGKKPEALQMAEEASEASAEEGQLEIPVAKPTLEKLTYELFDFIITEPRVFNRFYRSLSGSESKVVSEAVVSTPLKNLVSETTGIDFLQAASGLPEEEMVNGLQKITPYIKQYKKLSQMLQNLPFRYLEDVPSSQVVKTIIGLSPEKSLVVLNALKNPKNAEVLSSIPGDYKAKWLKTLLGKSGLPDLDEGVVELDRELKALFVHHKEQMSESIQPQKLLGAILQEDADIADTLAQSALSPEIIEKYQLQKYFMTFEQLLLLDDGFLQKILDKVGNEALALALLDVDTLTRERLLGFVSAIRKRIIDNLLATQVFDLRAAKEAKNLFLKEYRGMA
jgi:hypothetical protein